MLLLNLIKLTYYLALVLNSNLQYLNKTDLKKQKNSNKL